MNNITFLDLSDCALDKIPNCLSSAPNLTFLSLENNKICDLSNLEANTKIKTLQLSGNLVCNLKETAQLIGRMDELQVLDVRNNRFIPSAISNSQLSVLKMVLRVSLIIANENLLVLDQERISSAERKVARKRMEILRKYASNFSQRLNEGESFSEWKPILHPVQDMTVDDDLVLEIVH